LLSIVGDLGAAASERVSNARETSRAPNQAAAAALENDIRIPPRLRAPQGSEMTIFVARDVDFSNVYTLRLRR
jgi:type IV secretion system protein VirB10